VAWNADAQTNQAAYEILDAAGIPRYTSPVRCARGIAALWAFAEATQRRARTKDEAPLALTAPEWTKTLQGGTGADLTEFESKRLLTAYGIPVTREQLARDADEAVRAAEAIGLPVVMKIQSPDIPHKTEAGGVRIGVRSAAEVRSAFDEIIANAKAYAPDALIEGVVVQEMVSGGTELILGVTNDPLFGPAVMAGLGGVFAEVMKDVSFRLAPITRSEADSMLRELRGFPLLDGARGRPKADVAAATDALMRLSALAVDLRDSLAELDINPLAVLAAGRGVRALDGLAKPRQAAALKPE
jgi:acyl-CoA synthetase (NDP forming)